MPGIEYVTVPELPISESVGEDDLLLVYQEGALKATTPQMLPGNNPGFDIIDIGNLVVNLDFYNRNHKIVPTNDQLTQLLSGTAFSGKLLMPNYGTGGFSFNMISCSSRSTVAGNRLFIGVVHFLSGLSGRSSKDAILTITLKTVGTGIFEASITFNYQPPIYYFSEGIYNEDTSTKPYLLCQAILSVGLDSFVGIIANSKYLFTISEWNNTKFIYKGVAISGDDLAKTALIQIDYTSPATLNAMTVTVI